MTLSIKKEHYIYYYSIILIFIIFFLTLFVSGESIFIYLFLFVLTLPFYKHIDKLAVICFVLSTLSDYFKSASADIWSIYSIYYVIAMISFVTRFSHLNRKTVAIPFFLLIATIWLSYYYSSFHYLKGAFSLSYVVLFSLVIALTIQFNPDTLNHFLPLCAGATLIVLLIGVLLGPGLSPTTTISDTINHNAFGRSLAELSTILGVKCLVSDKASLVYKVIFAISLFFCLMTGSRNAFLALILSIFFIVFYYSFDNGIQHSNLFKFAFGLGLLSILLFLYLPEFGFDVNRYNYLNIISNGGTNRLALWRVLIPFLISNYFAFGYGPSYYCSANIIYPLIGRSYTNTHNTFIEAFGELGFVGLLSFIVLYGMSAIYLFRLDKKTFGKYYLIALFVDLFVNGFGEALFAGINFWILIGFCFALFSSSKTES